ncbi:MAG: Calx-beta domain-containing protein [Anaerolineae bacterium]
MKLQNPFALGRFLMTSLMIGILGTTTWPSSPIHMAHAAPLPITEGRVEGTLLEGTSPDWWGAAQEDIRQSEYQITLPDQAHFHDAGVAYQASNRAHNLRTYFTSRGIRVIPRVFEGDTTPWDWGLSLIGYGYPEAVQPVTAATLSVSGSRIEYRRGDLTEWYANDERGLEQGFTVASPVSPGRSSNLLLEFALFGNLRPTLAADGSAVAFSLSDGEPVLRYSDLHVYDAIGKELSANMRLADCDGVSYTRACRLQIDVDDSAALYPITIDPLILSPNWTAESDQVEAGFGYSVHTAGDVNGDGYADVIVGAYGYDHGETDEGGAFVYHGSATGLSGAADWTAEGDQPVANYGYSVSTAGDVNGDGYDDVIVGAYSYDITSTVVLTDAGQVYVYYGSASGLSASPDWTVAGDQENAYLGVSVGAAGDVNDDGYDDIVIGSYYDNGQVDEGQAYVYYGSASGLSTTPDWTAESDQDYAYFSGRVGTAGDVNGDGYDDVIIGAGGYDNGEADEGRAYVYHGSSSGLSATPNWTVESNQAGAEFGAVSTAGDVNGDGYDDVIVGARHYTNGQSQEGGVFVYHGSASGLSTTASATLESDQSGACLGQNVSAAGDVNGDGYDDIVVGAAGYDNPDLDEGRAYVFCGSASGVNTTPAWIEEGDQAGAWLGIAVGAAGDVNGDGYADVIVGACFYSNGQYREGRAYVYYGRLDVASLSPNWIADGNQVAATFGTTANTAGDVNGDGYDDVLVGASNYDGGEAGEGRGFLYYGSASGLSTSPAWTFESDQAGAGFGSGGGSAGDVNGDGYADVVIAANSYTGVYTASGRVYVFYGSASGLGLVPDWTVDGDQADLRLGISVGTAGDVNDDGYDDVIVATTEYGNGEAYEGVAYVYYGSAAGLSATPGWTVESNQAGARLGISAGTAGDVNGDGYDDVIVGAYWYDNDQSDEGRVFVYYGSASGLACGGGCPADADAVADWSAESNQGDSRFGWAVGTAGDVNGDGYDDVLIGAFWYDNDQVNDGRAFVYHGSVTGLACGAGCPVGPGDADWMVEGDQSDVGFAYGLSNVGDVNGDGFDDVAIGAPWYNSGQTDEGKVFIYFGWSSGLNTTPNWTAETDQSSETRFGAALGPAGDVNGDGYDDIVVGGYYYTADQANEGRVFVYYGWAPGTVTDCSNYSATGGLGPALSRGGTITFKCNGTIVIPATIAISKDMTLDASGQHVTISGNNATRVFYVNSGVTLTLKSLTVANGYVVGAAGTTGTPAQHDPCQSGGTGGVGGDALGGGLYNNGGTVIVIDSTFSNNSVVGGSGGDGGAGISGYSYSCWPSTCWHSGHFGGSGGSGGGGKGGGVYNNGGVVAVSNSTFSGNSATGGTGGNAGYDAGAGTWAGGSGGAGYGGAFYSDGGAATLTNNTFSGNDATGGNGGYSPNSGMRGVGGNGYGGGFYDAGSTVTVNDNTVSGNGAHGGYGAYPASDGVGYSGGIYNSSGTVTLKNTIVANNTGGNCSGTVSSAGYNLDSANTCSLAATGDIINTNPLLGPLQDNGGATFTRALLQGSPAINAGNPLPPGWYPDSCARYDQRGVFRPLGGRCDIGAYETHQVQFGTSAFSVNENAGAAAITVTIASASPMTVTVDYVSGDGTATAGDDYSAISGTLAITPGVISGVFYVPLIDNLVDEPDETFTVTLSSPGGAVLGTPLTTTVTIADDDFFDLSGSYKTADTSFAEPGSLVTYTVVLSNSGNLTATAVLTDPIPSGVTILTSTLTGGAVYDTQENRITYGGTVLAHASHEISFTVLVGGLSSGTVVVNTAQIDDGTSVITRAVSLTVVNAPPVAGDDTTSTPEDTPRVIAVLGNDSDPNDDPLAVVAVGTPTEGVAGTNGATVTYTPTLNFNGQDVFTYTISDGALTDTATVTVTVTAVNDPPVAVNDSGSGFTTDEDTAFITGNVLANDSDPDASDTLSVSGLDTSGTLGSVANNGDGTFDYDPDDQFEYLAAGEQATDTLTYTVSDGNGGTDTAVVTITINGVNEEPAVGFDRPVYSEDEDVGLATFTVTLDAASASIVTVDYATSDGTAKAGSDYVSASGTLTFTPGVTIQTFSVAIINDPFDEDNETAILTLSSAHGATLDGANPATLTILDNDDPPTVDFGSAAYSITENEGTLTMNVTLDSPSGRTITVTYTTSDGTATAGEDYVAISGTLVFTPGITNQTITITIISDELDENDETIIVTLSDVENATTGDNNPAVLTVVDKIKIYLPLVIRNY